MGKKDIDLDELSFELNRQALGLGPLPAPVCIGEGEISDSNGVAKTYEINIGIIYQNLKEIAGWNGFTLSILSELVRKLKDDPAFPQIIQSGIMIEDIHWDWISKALSYWQDEYLWFSLRVDSIIEAVAIIFYPKPSAFDHKSIYYIEYLSSAPWNRLSAFYSKKYHGVGKELLKGIQLYINTNLKYRFGFSLHSLPQAIGFYSHIGMVSVDTFDKGCLKFLEMPEKKAKQFCGVQ